MSRDAIEKLQTSKEANTGRAWDACLETVEAISKWTPKERLERKPADQELFPGLPLSGFFLRNCPSRNLKSADEKHSKQENSTKNFKNLLEPDFILPLC